MKHDFLPRYDQVLKTIAKMCNTFPELHLQSIGKSVLHRDIYALSVGQVENGATLFVGGTHGQEWLTVSLLLLFVDELLSSIQSREPLEEIDFSLALQKRGLIVIPALNPDGIEIALNGPKSAGWRKNCVKKILEKSDLTWQANARGVDLNHNFDAGFSILQKLEREAGFCGPSPRRYGGKRPLSEPESRVIVKYVRKHNISRLYAFHSQGEEIFYEYDNIPVPQGEEIAQTLSKLSGYQLVKNAGLYSHGGLKDWFIKEFHQPGFTVEIGKGENPLPLSDLDSIYRKIRRMMAAAVIL